MVRSLPVRGQMNRFPEAKVASIKKKSLFYRPGKGAKILDDRAEAKQTHQKMDSVSENSEDDLL